MNWWPFKRHSTADTKPARLRQSQAANRDGGRVYFDGAATGRHSDKHFLSADGSDLGSLIAADITALRNRCNYEIANNGYAKGIVNSYAQHVVDTGPRLQIKATDPNDPFPPTVESEFAAWAEVCDVEGRQSFAEILQLGLKQIFGTGDHLVVFTRAKRADSATPVQLRLKVYEAHRLATPLAFMGDDDVADGIRYDPETGAPTEYYIAQKHPGSSRHLALQDKYDAVPAAQVIHLYDLERPEQGRGAPRLQPSLNIFSQLRRWTLACLSSAEFAANIAAFLKSTADVIDEDAQDPNVMEELELYRNALMTLPRGWDVSQIKTEQPPTTFKEFKRELINEGARPVSMPLNIALGNSEGYNYSSGRLDHQSFFRAIHVEQAYLSRHICNRVLLEWLREAARIPGYLPSTRSLRVGTPTISPAQRGDSRWHTSATLRFNAVGLPKAAKPDTVYWFWRGQEHVDPQKEATARATNLKIGATTLPDEYAKEGKDWEPQLNQRALVARRALDLVKAAKADGYPEIKPEHLCPHIFGEPAAPAAKALPDPAARRG